MNSFFPDGIKAWNNIIVHFPNFPSLNILKGHILSLNRPVKKTIFDIHDPIGLRYLFYLRVGLSLWRTHKNCHGFQDTPSGTCSCDQGVEDTNHFLFSCPLFVNHRATLMDGVTAILQRCNLLNLVNRLHLYLYDHRIIGFNDNRQIIFSTIKFIKETQRFSA